MAGSRHLKLSPDKSSRAKGAPKNSKPLLCIRQGTSANPTGQVRHPGLAKIPGHLARRVPHSRLPLVEAHVAVCFKPAGQGAMHMPNPVRPVDYSVDIVQKGYQRFLHANGRALPAVLGAGQARAKPLCLLDDARHSSRIVPNILRGLGVKHPDKRETLVCPRHAKQALQHGLATHSTDPVDRDNGRLRVELANNALSTCPGRQGELEGAASRLEAFCWAKSTGDQATGEVTNNNATDPAVGLAQSDEPPEPECSGCIMGNAGLSNQLQHTDRLVGRILVI